MDITRWWNHIDLFFAAKDGEALYSRQKQDWELTVAQAGKTTIPFRYDLNQIPYDYTVEVTNRFKGLDLIDKSAWLTVDRGSWHCIGGSDQDHPQEKEMQKESLPIAKKRNLAKSCLFTKCKGDKDRYIHLNAEFSPSGCCQYFLSFSILKFECFGRGEE